MTVHRGFAPLPENKSKRVIRAIRLFMQVEALRRAEEFAGEELSRAIQELPPGTMAHYIEKTRAALESFEALDE